MRALAASLLVLLLALGCAATPSEVAVVRWGPAAEKPGLPPYVIARYLTRKFKGAARMRALLAERNRLFCPSRYGGQDAEVSGWIFDDATDRPLVGVRVIAEEWSPGKKRGEVLTDAKGDFALPLPAGVYRVRLVEGESCLVEASVCLGTGSPLVLKLRIQRTLTGAPDLCAERLPYQTPGRGMGRRDDRPFVPPRRPGW